MRDLAAWQYYAFPVCPPHLLIAMPMYTSALGAQGKDKDLPVDLIFGGPG